MIFLKPGFRSVYYNAAICYSENLFFFVYLLYSLLYKFHVNWRFSAVFTTACFI